MSNSKNESIITYFLLLIYTLNSFVQKTQNSSCSYILALALAPSCNLQDWEKLSLQMSRLFKFHILLYILKFIWMSQQKLTCVFVKDQRISTKPPTCTHGQVHIWNFSNNSSHVRERQTQWKSLWGQQLALKN